MERRAVMVAGAVALVLVVSACGGSGSAARPDDKADGQASAEAGSPTSGGGSSAELAATAADPEALAEIAGKLELPSAPVATVPTNVNGLNLEVWAISRSGGAATVAFAVTNTTAEEYGLFTDLSAAGGGAFDVSAVSLVDAANLKRYLVLTDSDGGCVCSKAGVTIGSGQSSFFYATFTAPPPEVTRITVETAMGSVVGVPITDV